MGKEQRRGGAADARSRSSEVKLNNKGVCPVFRCGERFSDLPQLYRHLGEAHMGDISGGGGGGGGGRGGEGGHAAATDEVGGKDLRALKGSLQDLDKGERLEVAAELVESSRSMDEKESVLPACAAKARFFSLSRLSVSAVAGGGFGELVLTSPCCQRSIVCLASGGQEKRPAPS